MNLLILSNVQLKGCIWKTEDPHTQFSCFFPPFSEMLMKLRLNLHCHIHMHVVFLVQLKTTCSQRESRLIDDMQSA